MLIEPIFFPATDGVRLCGVWRASTPDAAPAHCWVICPPFAEEEKSAHRTLVELADALVARGDACLLFAFRGTGDSDGEFSHATLSQWRDDIRAACAVARARYPASTPGLIGLRLGASLASQVASSVGARKLILIEPILHGRSFVSHLGARKKLRAMLTDEEAGGKPQATESRPAKAPHFEDIDGWPLGAALREELRSLDLSSQTPDFDGEALVLQVSPHERIAPPLTAFARALNDAASRAVVLPPFWNRLDYVFPSPLLETITDFEWRKADAPNELMTDRDAIATPQNAKSADWALTISNAANQTLTAICHDAKSTASKPNLVFLHGWTGYRTGPHQMLTRAARRFATRGHAGLRFDFAGRGDSEGEATLSTLATMADDARAAIRWMNSQNSSAPIVLVGLCSGCEVAFAISDEPGVTGLVLWSAPVFAAGHSSERVSRKRAQHLKEYARKLMRPATWGKVLSGRLDVKGVRKVVGQGGGEEHKNIEADEPGQLPPGWREDAIRRFEKVHVPSLLVYGTADPTTEEALAWHRGQLRVPPEVHLVNGANHSYYGLNWENEVFRATEDWLARLPTTL